MSGTVGELREVALLVAVADGPVRFLTFMERAAPTAAFSPSFQDGFMLSNNFLEEKRLLVALSAFKATTNGTATDNGGYGVATRFAAFFLEDKDSNRILHVGFGTKRVDDSARSAQRVPRRLPSPVMPGEVAMS